MWRVVAEKAAIAITNCSGGGSCDGGQELGRLVNEVCKKQTALVANIIVVSFRCEKTGHFLSLKKWPVLVS